MKFNINLFAVLLILIAGFLYYQVVLGSPIIFGDEGHYASVGRWVSQNNFLPEHQPYWGTDIYRFPLTRPPLYYFFNAISWSFFGELGVKLLIPLFSVLSAFMLFLFFKKNNKPKAGLAAAFILLMLPGLITYGVMNYVEASLVLFFICSAYFGFFAFKEKSLNYSILSGVFAGFSILTDITGILIIPLFFLYFLITKRFNQWKNLLIIFVLAGVLLTPFFARNLVLYNGFCFPFLPGECNPVLDIEIETFGVESSMGAVAEIGTGANIMKMGWTNYFRFAFGWTASILLIFGIANLLQRKNNMNLFLSAWLILFLFLTLHQAFFGGRAEDVPRYTLYGFPVVAAISGLFIGNTYNFIKKYGKIIGIAFLIIFLFATFVYGQEKLNTMYQVKHNLIGIEDACKWIKVNTNKDSLIYGIYAHQEAYQCNRKVQSDLPDKEIIRMWANETSYEHLKTHGYDYIIVEQFTVSVTPYGEATPLQFLNYLESSENFKKVYDNTNVYGEMGLKVYQVM